MRRVLLLLCVPLSAAAWPVDLYLDLETGSEKRKPLSALSWVEVEDAKVATARVLESGELSLAGVSPGRTLLLLYAEGRFAVWRLRVAKQGERPTAIGGEPEQAAARKACPRLEVAGEGEPTLSATIPEEKCRQALLALFRTDRFHARQLELTFEVSALQAQLVSMEQGVKAAVRPKIELSYLGAGLLAKGALDGSEHRKVLWELFRRAAGRVALEDRMEVRSP